MITIAILGLDQFAAAHYSKENSENLANLFEIDEDELNFYSPEAAIFHKGIEQTSWHALVVVSAPERFEAFEEKIADYLFRTLTVYSINVEIRFEYFHEHHHYEQSNPNYPRYITSENVVHLESDHVHDEDDEEPYLGNPFEGHEEELDHLYGEDEDDD